MIKSMKKLMVFGVVLMTAMIYAGNDAQESMLGRSLRRTLSVPLATVGFIGFGVEEMLYGPSDMIDGTTWFDLYKILLPETLYNFATDPLVATAVGGMAAYYLYQKYMASQKKAQPEEDVKNEDADNKVAD